MTAEQIPCKPSRPDPAATKDHPRYTTSTDLTEGGGVAKPGDDVVAGLYVVDVADTDEAVEWAKRIPTATYGKVEVRPIVEFY